MPEYAVLTAKKKRDLEDKGYGPSVVYTMDLQSPEGVIRGVDVIQKPDTPVPSGTLTGTIEQGQYGPRFRKEKKFGAGGGGGRQTHPVDAARMSRCHAQHMALLWLAKNGNNGMNASDCRDVEALRPLIDWFQQDAERTTAASPQSSPVVSPPDDGGAISLEEFVQLKAWLRDKKLGLGAIKGALSAIERPVEGGADLNVVENHLAALTASDVERLKATVNG